MISPPLPLMPTASNSSNDSYSTSVSFFSPLTYDGSAPRSNGSKYSWDVAACCQPLLSTFNYFSSKLAYQGLHVAIVVLNTKPELLSAWPIDIHTQQFLSKLIARADVKYSLDYNWVKALNDLCKPVDSGEAFETYRATTYLIHRTSLQRDIIFSGDGLTVLAVDYIYKFKEQLSTLASESTFPLFRDDCTESTVELLKHINTVYKDIPMSKAYLRRAYTQFPFNEDVLDEVCLAYHHKYSSTTTFDSLASTSVAVQPPSNSVLVVDDLQESPRKLPFPPKKTRSGSTSTSASAPGPHSFSARALSRKPLTLQQISLGQPFEFDPFFNYNANAVERPRSPKGELFEAPRSAPSTPRKASIPQSPPPIEEMPHAMTTNETKVHVSPESTKAETASIMSTRRRRLLQPWLGLSRSNTVGSMKDNASIKSSRSRKMPSGFRLASARSKPEMTSRSSSMTRSTSVFPLGLDKEIAIPTEPVPPIYTTNTSVSASVTPVKAVDSKFGWLHVMKKSSKGRWDVPRSQRIL